MITAEVKRSRLTQRVPNMFLITQSEIRQASTLSSMSLCDRLITLAKDADAAGYAITADQLVQLAMTIFDEAPRRAN